METGGSLELASLALRSVAGPVLKEEERLTEQGAQHPAGPSMGTPIACAHMNTVMVFSKYTGHRAYTHNPSIGKAAVGRGPQVQVQPGLSSEFQPSVRAIV